MHKHTAQRILEILRKKFPKQTRGPFVEWSNPLELTVATVLSAQSTDVRVNRVTKMLFKKYKTASDYARADLNDLERIIKPVGFYHVKARYVHGIGKRLLEAYGGTVPRTFEELLTLPGVARKSAYLIMAKAWGKPTGVAVDTHTGRVAERLGLTAAHAQNKIERDLDTIFDPKDYLDVNELFIMHGRATCTARKPRCPECPLRHLCPSAKKFIKMYWKR